MATVLYVYVHCFYGDVVDAFVFICCKQVALLDEVAYKCMEINK